MIYEIRTYVLAVGTLCEVEKRFGEAYEHRKKYSELAAFWHTDIGPLNEIIHVWPYRDLAGRAREGRGLQGSELAAQNRRVRPLHAIRNPGSLSFFAVAHPREVRTDL